MDKEVEVKEVIISYILRRGDGVNDPIRRILQVFDKDGALIAENDPCGDTNYNHPQVPKIIEETTNKIAVMCNENSSQNDITKCIELGFEKLINFLRN